MLIKEMDAICFNCFVITGFGCSNKESCLYKEKLGVKVQVFKYT